MYKSNNFIVYVFIVNLHVLLKVPIVDLSLSK